MTLHEQRPGGRGMTLVELLVATVIAVLLLAVVFSTYRTVSLVRGGLQERTKTTHAAAAALDQLQQDLMRAFIPFGDGACAVILTQNLEHADLAFCVSRPSTSEADLRWARIFRVAYRVDGDKLISIVRPLSGPGSLDGMTTNVIASGVDKFSVALFDGDAWREHWPAAETNGKPRAARIAIATTDKKSVNTEVWIPAGTVFTSSIIRATDVAPAPSPGATVNP